MSAGPYFRDAGRSISKRKHASSFEASAYASVRILADILSREPETGWADLPAAFSGRRFQTPFGETEIDPQTQHATMPVVIGQIEGTGFRQISRQEAVAPDPYLSRYDRSIVFGRPRLKAVP